MEATLVRPEAVELLQQTSLFADVPRAEIEDLAGRLRLRHYARGEVVYHQDDPPGGLFLVQSGVVKLRLSSPQGKQVTIDWRRRGHFFGTISLAGDVLRQEDAVALAACELFVLSRDDFQAFMRSHPENGQYLLRVLAQRWSYMIGRFCDLAFLDVPERVAKVLLRFSAAYAEELCDGGALIRHMTQPELAALVGATRESVHKCVQGLSRQGIVSSQREGIAILQPAALRGLVP